MKRTPLPRGKTTLKRSPLKKRSKTPEEKQQQSEDIEKMWKLMEEHWQLKGEGRIYKMCESCQDAIWGENKTLYHHHLLEKGVERYKHLKYELGNLMLLCADCHTRVTNGFPSEEVRKRTEEVKQKYGL